MRQIAMLLVLILLAGWFPSSDEFTVDAAFVVAGLPQKKGSSYSTYKLKIEGCRVGFFGCGT